MAQFDVHRYTGKSRDLYPFVMIVQSSDFDAGPKKVVVPLVEKSKFGKIDNPTLNPALVIEGVELVFQPLEIAAMDKKSLGSYSGSASSESTKLVDSLDELFSTAYG